MKALPIYSVMISGSGVMENVPERAVSVHMQCCKAFKELILGFSILSYIGRTIAAWPIAMWVVPKLGFFPQEILLSSVQQPKLLLPKDCHQLLIGHPHHYVP
jgi:hypothetical protein